MAKHVDETFSGSSFAKTLNEMRQKKKIIKLFMQQFLLYNKSELLETYLEASTSVLFLLPGHTLLQQCVRNNNKQKLKLKSAECVQADEHHEKCIVTLKKLHLRATLNQKGLGVRRRITQSALMDDFQCRLPLAEQVAVWHQAPPTHAQREASAGRTPPPQSQDVAADAALWRNGRAAV